MDLEELKEMDASEIHAKRLNAKELILLPKSGENYKIHSRIWNSEIVRRRPGTENIHLDIKPSRGESHQVFLGESEGSSFSKLISGCR